MSPTSPSDSINPPSALTGAPLGGASGNPSGQRGLEVSFCGETHDIPAHGWTFGRAADLEIDDNPYLHRRLGRLEFRQGLWWLDNLGDRLSLVVKDQTSRSQATLAPGRSLVLTMSRAVIQFQAGRCSYELELDVRPSVPRVTKHPPSGNEDGDGDGDTISVNDLPLTDDQRRLILVLSAPALRSPGAEIRLPTNREAAHRLGWTITRFNRKLDNVCERLSRAGVSGLRGQPGTVAVDRRRRLVEHAVGAGLVDLTDIGLLEPPPGPDAA